jgi:TP901 family phage tail tape measure protein
MSGVAVIGVQLDVTKPVRDLKKLENAVNKVQGTANSSAASLDKLGKGAGGARAVGAAAKAAVPGVAALGGALKAALGPIAILTTAAGALSSAFSTLATQDFAEAKVRSLGVDSEALTKQLKGVSRELAGQADVVELTSAAYDVASAGFTNAADAANILKAASLGATGGFSDINTVGDAATSVLNAYGMQADKAGKLVDGFIQTQNDGKIVIGEYAANIAKVAPVAAALGVPLEEVNAAVAQITAGGQGAEVTFTALKTAFAQIAAGKVGKEFEGLGVEITAATLQSDGLAGTLEKIKKSGADAGTVIKAFGTEAGPSILALLNDTEKYNKLLQNQKDSQGAAAKAAFEASDTINGALKRLQTAFTNLFADGSELGILLKGIFQVAAVTVEVFAAAINMLLAPIRGIGQAAAEFFQELLPFEENVNLAYELEQGFQAIMEKAEFATAVVTGFFKSVAGLAYDALSAVIDFGKGIASQVVQAFANLGSVIHEKLTNIYKALPEPLKTLVDMAVGAANAVGSFVSGAASSVVNTVGEGVNAMAQAGGFGQDQQTSGTGTSPAANNIQTTNNQLGGNNATKQQKEKVKMTQQEFDLRQAIRDAKLTESKVDDVNAKFALKQFQIGQQFNDDVLGQKSALLDAELSKNQELQQIEQDRLDAQAKAAKEAADRQQKELEADPMFQMKQKMEELLDVQNQVAAGAQVIGNAFAGAFKSVITGSKTAGEALKDMLAATAEHFLDMAMQIIAQQITMILYGTIMKALGISMPGGGGGGMSSKGFFDPMTGKGVAGPNFGLAEGAYVSGPTNALIAEGGEPEYVIPESKMRESMSRYSRGARGSSVIPESGSGDSGTTEDTAGLATSTPIDVRYTVDRINSVDYVTADQFQNGMRQAANQGAKQGEQQALRRLQMSGSTRKRLGM